jgi:hypothetical protein
MIFLRADTNTEVLIGPAVAVGDGFTPVTTLATSGADEAELIKYGGSTPLTTTSISASAMTAITGADGYYTLDLSTGNTDTEGFLVVLFNDDSLILPLRHEFHVLNANTYDALFDAAGTDTLQVDLTQIVGGTVPTPTTTGVPDVNVERWSDTLVTLGAGAPDVNVASMDAGSIASGVIAAAELTNIENEIWDAPMASHITAGSMGLANNVIRANVATAGAAGTITLDAGASTVADYYNGAIITLVNGTGAGQSRRITDYTVTTQIASVEPNWITNPASGTEFVILHGGNADLRTATQTSVDAIEADTNELQGDWADAGRLDAILDARMAEASINTTGGAVDTVTTVTNDVGITAAAVDLIWDETMAGHVTADTAGLVMNEWQDAGRLDAILDNVLADTDDIQTRLPAALIGGRMDSDVEAINNDATAAGNLRQSTLQVITGQAEATPSTTVIQTDLAETQDDIYIGRIIIFTSGNAKDEATDITDYTGSTGTVTCTALANAPAATDTFIII